METWEVLLVNGLAFARRENAEEKNGNAVDCGSYFRNAYGVRLHSLYISPLPISRFYQMPHY